MLDFNIVLAMYIAVIIRPLNYCIKLLCNINTGEAAQVISIIQDANKAIVEPGDKVN